MDCWTLYEEKSQGTMAWTSCVAAPAVLEADDDAGKSIEYCFLAAFLEEP